MNRLHYALPLAVACTLACSTRNPSTISYPPPSPTDGAVSDDVAPAGADVALPGPDSVPSGLDTTQPGPDTPPSGLDGSPTGMDGVGPDGTRPALDAGLPDAASSGVDSGSGGASWPDDELRALVAQMTFDEKVAQLGNNAPAIPRLKIPAYDYWNECLHGVVPYEGGWSSTDPSTSFPQAIALASTWDPALVEEVASAISDEARAFHVKNGKGLTFWAPVINILRDPRWGRYEESYTEDPWLMARTAVAYVHGLQGRDPKFLKAVATPKHYVGNNSEYNRHNGSSDIDEQLLHEYYLPGFEAAVREGGAFSVMSAYNEVNGVPASANPLLLKDILRGAWGFKGYVVSDCDAVWDIANNHHWTDSIAQAAGRALLAGTDLNCGSTYPNELGNARDQGFVAEADVDLALTRVLRARFLLGEFSPASEVPWSAIDASVIESQAHADLALKAARAAIVLLKNDGGLLPLDATTLHSIAVIGPHANDVTLGGYTGYPSHRVSVLDAINTRFASSGVKVDFQQGGTVTGALDSDAIAAAAEAARTSDVALVLVGTSTEVLGEERDRPDWSLPGAQGDLVQAVFAANPRTIVVLVTAGPVAVDWAQANVPAILTAFYDGQEQGTAITDVLFGDYNPGGKLTTTWYKGDATLPPIGDYDLRKGRTYLYYTDQPLYPFGFGLSYSTFAYSNLVISPAAIAATGAATVSVDVTNSGARAGDEVVQMYIHDAEASVTRPIQELRGFRRIHLAPGQTTTVSFPLAAANLAFWDSDNHDWKVEAGSFEVRLGSSSDDIRVRGSLTVPLPPDASVADAAASD
jgi:beta-glucosidase